MTTDTAAIGSVGRTYRRFGLHNTRLGFRRFRRTRPFWGGLWTVLGGTLIAYVPATAFKFIFATTSIALGIAVGAVIGALGLLLWVQPKARTLYGIAIIALSLVSFVTSDFGGLFLGMVMGIVGGSLAVSWVPRDYRSRRQRRKAARAQAEPVIDLSEGAEAASEPGIAIVLPDVTPQTPAVIDLTAAEHAGEGQRESRVQRLRRGHAPRHGR